MKYARFAWSVDDIVCCCVFTWTRCVHGRMLLRLCVFVLTEFMCVCELCVWKRICVVGVCVTRCNEYLNPWQDTEPCTFPVHRASTQSYRTEPAPCVLEATQSQYTKQVHTNSTQMQCADAMHRANKQSKYKDSEEDIHKTQSSYHSNYTNNKQLYLT